MRQSIRFFAMLLLAVALFAADPFVGTWKMDPSKSKSPPNVPNAATIAFEQQGENYQVTVTGTNPDGSPMSIKYTVPIKGGSAQIENGGEQFDAVTTKRLSARQRDNTYSKNGKEVGIRHLAVSKDGKTLTITLNGTDPQGNPVTSVQVFDKQ
jgi:hypothetical protein